MSRREQEREEFLSVASPRRVVPVARTFPSDALTPVTLFRRMRRSGQECFLLESVEGGEAIARYTFLGCGPVARLTIRGGALEQESGGSRQRGSRRRLEGAVTARGPTRLPRGPGSACRSRAGAVGFLSYDAVRLFEAIPDSHPPEGEVPDGLFLLFGATVAFDHPRQRLLLLTNIGVERAAEKEKEVDAAIARLDRLENFLREELPAPRRGNPVPARRDKSAKDRRESAGGHHRLLHGRSLPGTGINPDFAPLMPRAKFLEAVGRAKEAILAGDIYQVVLSQRWTGSLDVDPFDVYRALRMLNPSPYLFYLETREAAVFGASPEMLVRCRGRRDRDPPDRRHGRPRGRRPRRRTRALAARCSPTRRSGPST